MKKLGFRATIVALSGMSACASAPFYDGTTARTLGKSQTSMAVGGQAASGGTLQFAHGLAQDWDLGFQMEFGSLFSSTGFFVKYGIVNPLDEGFALSAMLGAGGAGAKSRYGFAGSALSYKYRWIEPALFLRYNVVSDKEDFFAESSRPISLNSREFEYGLLSPSLAFWFTAKMTLAFNLSVVLGGPRLFREPIAVSGGSSFQINF